MQSATSAPPINSGDASTHARQVRDDTRCQHYYRKFAEIVAMDSFNTGIYNPPQEYRVLETPPHHREQDQERISAMLLTQARVFKAFLEKEWLWNGRLRKRKNKRSP